MFSSFAERSQQKELMDLGEGHYTPEEYTQCLQKLFKINKLLEFFKSTFKTLKNFSRQSAISTLMDIGCGNGLFILHLSRFFPKTNMKGIDMSSDAIKNAQELLEIWQKSNPDLSVSFEVQDKINANPDIILATLVCHHMTDQELVEFLRDAHARANKAIIINDLHRHRLAYWLYALISPVLFRNRLITHDGLISIQRGFIRAEWKLFLHQAGIKNYTLKWRFPFRWEVTVMCGIRSAL